MKKDFLNICYRFINRFITVNELIEQLTEFNNKEVNDLVNKLKEVEKNNPNKEDDFVIKKKESIKKFLDVLNVKPTDDESAEFLKNKTTQLKKEYEKEIDSKDRWMSVFECLSSNDYFNKEFESLSDYELLEFIAQYINVPFPPSLKQEEFDKLVKAGIEKDEREWLWRLAFNYEYEDINIDKIAQYFIDMKDGYYLSELVSAVGEKLDIDKIIDMINDKKLIEDLKDRKDVMSSFVSDEQFNKLMNKL